jgi:hydroxymethylpyrimidine/phosphomethylpyrimidine kinase
VDLHGTGCALSSAIAALLAQGRPLFDAVGEGRAYVEELLEAGSAIAGTGRALADHLWPLRARSLHGDVG